MAKHGGDMHYERKGQPRYGAWVLTLNGKTVTLPSQGRGTFPELDRLYVSKKVEPRGWVDTQEHALYEDAEEYLLKLFE